MNGFHVMEKVSDLDAVLCQMDMALSRRRLPRKHYFIQCLVLKKGEIRTNTQRMSLVISIVKFVILG